MTGHSGQEGLPFVVQEHHDAAGVHWDLMLLRPVDSYDPNAKLLATWKFLTPPITENLIRPLPAQVLPDHRQAYLTYQGPISNGRGLCTIFDRGRYDLVEMQTDLWRGCFHGERLIGVFTLQLIAHPDQWEMRLANQAVEQAWWA